MTQLMPSVEGVKSHMEYHAFHDDRSVDMIEVTAVIVVQGLIGPVTLQSAGCIAYKPAEG